MTKANITQYDSTPSNNADINDINIAENCPASNINNAIRELMAHLKNVDTGSQALTALSVTGDLTVDTSTLKVDSSNNRVGVGTASPSTTLTVVDDVSIEGSSPTLALADTDVSNNKVELSYDEFLTIDLDPNDARGNTGLIVKGDGSEALRLTSDRHLLIGTTTDGTTAVGTVIRDAGEVLITRDSNPPLLLNRNTSSGDVIEIRHDNTRIGSIQERFGNVQIGSANNNLLFNSGAGEIAPAVDSGGISDDVVDLGANNRRFDNIHATNGTIQTSDRNEKQDIEELTDAEKRVATVSKGLMRKFRWKSRVAEKGDNARTHFGIIAQDLEDAFKAEGLDAGKYGMFISSTWWETEEKYTDENGKEQTRILDYKKEEDAPKDATKKTRLGVRYSELLAFIISAI
tara:strand:- start:461 stop:1669 length:1209 start_codon:yes stop_codon:yes gene_type:complete